MTGRGAWNRRGASTLGCLLTLVVFLGAMYYGSRIGGIYWRHSALLDRMRVAARFAANQTDETIRRQLVVAVDELGLPREAKRFRIRRYGNPTRIVIETRYSESFELPVLDTRTVKFRPRIENAY